MSLDSLMLKNFRNYSEAKLTFHPKMNLICGDNGQGKSNLLEAIYVLGNLKSWRTAKSRDLIKIGEEDACLRGLILQRGVENLYEVGVSASGKIPQINGERIGQIQDYFENIRVLVFSPEDMTFIKGAPQERRKFLDRSVFTSSPPYLEEIRRFQIVLHHRNSLLKCHSFDERLFTLWTDRFVESAIPVIKRRYKHIERLAPYVNDFIKEITEGKGELTLSYESSLAEGDADEMKRELARSLAEKKEEEIFRGFSLLGPHRDDVGIEINQKEVRRWASQGEQKTAIFAIKLAELGVLRERGFSSPIFLIDDVMSEMDQRRSEHFLELSCSVDAQIFMTTPRAGLTHPLMTEGQTFSVKEGEIYR